MRAACVQCRVRKQVGSKSIGGYAIQLPPKRRGTEACLECRAMKARCSRDSPRCTNCQRRNKQCSYASVVRSATLQEDLTTNDTSRALPQQLFGVGSELASATSATSGSVASPISTISNSVFLSDDVSKHLIETYFDCLSPLPSFSFLHKETVVQRCLDGSIDPALRLAICAITSLFLNLHQAQRMEWAQEAERLMFDRLEKPSIFMIQASVLTIRFRAGVGQFPRAFILAGLAARWAVALRLNYEHSGLGPIAQEVRRRTLWSLYLLEDSLFNRKICAKEMTQSELFSCIERHRTDLLRVRTRFAARDQYPESTPGQPFWPPQYALLHISWHQCHCDLYRPFINDYPELGPHAVLNGMSEPDRKLMRDKCFDHAEHIVQILSEFLHRKKEQHLLEHDAAYFSFSAQLKNMRQSLANAIEQHKSRWQNSRKIEAEKNMDQVAPNISRDAQNRQRLAIHSLLRQSDFVDDSREAALEPVVEQVSTTNTTVAPVTVEATQEGRVDWSIQDTIYPLWNSIPADSNAIYGIPFGAGMVEFGNGMTQSMGDLDAQITGVDEQGMY
ncbi:hypothetical protein GRF29_164g229873 [Pseudopithomyces chartarum]|uniref:Zn(2)-C6 fungal-type domain-containing protein n=1 Tax=Pseudopithomyces chartarum TaxID=1892770 RepID=A0AAN6LNU3_9PLEO|nr:hypothetical protein GRF29_164g229873 [Pseudopithomyces chartarum]